MFTPPQITSLRLTEDGTEAQVAIAAATQTLIGSKRADPQLRILLAGAGLAAKTIATLISAQRKLREVGGAIELQAENETVRRIVGRHALERIFGFPPVPSAPAAGWHVFDAVACAVSHAITTLDKLLRPSPAHFNQKQLSLCVSSRRVQRRERGSRPR